MYEIKNISKRLYVVQSRQFIPGKTEVFKQLSSGELAVILACVEKGEMEIIRSPHQIKNKLSNPYPQYSYKVESKVGTIESDDPIDEGSVKFIEEKLDTKKKPGRKPKA